MISGSEGRRDVDVMFMANVDVADHEAAGDAVDLRPARALLPLPPPAIGMGCEGVILPFMVVRALASELLLLLLPLDVVVVVVVVTPVPAVAVIDQRGFASLDDDNALV